MNRVYSDASLLPLFGAQTQTVAHATDQNIEIVRFGSHGFEKRQVLFWTIFERTISQLLAEYIEYKSLRLALRYLNKPEIFVESNGNGANHLLDHARQGFGQHRVAELFHLKTRFFNASSPLMQHFCENVASAAALDDVYNAVGSFAWNGQRLYPLSASPDVWSSFYLSCPNGQAVRNRYRQVARLYEQHGGGRALSIACGSAQPLIHALRALKSSGRGEDSQLILTDVSKESLALAQERAEQAGVDDQVVCKRVSLRGLVKHFSNEKFNVVEACGIFDYLPDEQVIKLLQFAFNSLDSKGSIIVSNMNRTRGARLLLKMYNWPICYRTPLQFGQLISQAGGRNVKVYVEPWEIHPVATATL